MSSTGGRHESRPSFINKIKSGVFRLKSHDKDKDGNDNNNNGHDDDKDFEIVSDETKDNFPQDGAVDASQQATGGIKDSQATINRLNQLSNMNRAAGRRANGTDKMRGNSFQAPLRRSGRDRKAAAAAGATTNGTTGHMNGHMNAAGASNGGVGASQAGANGEITRPPRSHSRGHVAKPQQPKRHSMQPNMTDMQRKTKEMEQEQKRITRRHKKRKHIVKVKNEKFLIYDYYTPVRIIGIGAYATVIEAVDERTNSHVAIKKNKGVFNALSDAKRILREIKLLLHFDHENVMALTTVITPEPDERDSFQDVYLVMPIMETTLSRIIRSSQQLTERHLQYFIYQMLLGLHYIHSAGVLHRDLKPENILVNGSDCKLRITDFGLARGVCKDDGEKLTEYVVTRWYRAPEVMCSSREYGESIDVWSVGCMMGELYRRKPLFPGQNHVEQVKVVFKKLGFPRDTSWIITPDARRWITGLEGCEGDPLSTLVPGASDEALDLCGRLLTVNPNERITVLEAIRHPWLSHFYRENDLKQCSTFDLSFEFEKAINSLFGVRHMMYTELTHFHDKRRDRLGQTASV